MDDVLDFSVIAAMQGGYIAEAPYLLPGRLTRARN